MQDKRESNHGGAALPGFTLKVKDIFA